MYLNTVLNSYDCSTVACGYMLNIFSSDVNIHTESLIQRSNTKSHSKITCFGVFTLGHLDRMVCVNFEPCRLICSREMKLQFFIICSYYSRRRLFIIQCLRNYIWQTAQPKIKLSLKLRALTLQRRPLYVV